MDERSKASTGPRRWRQEIAIGAVSAALVVAGCSTAGGEKTLTRAELLKPETCKQCHADHYDEWSRSMHAYASEDPLFRAMNARGQRETGNALGDFCVKCHAPLAVSEGATHDGSNLDDLAPELKGVTCYFCHNAKSVEGTHNNPLVLSNDLTLRGGVTNPVSNGAHVPEYSPLFDGNDVAKSTPLCGGCHDIVVGHELSGGTEDVALERTYQEWQGSLFNLNPNGQLSCTNCHMSSLPGVPIATSPGVPSGRTRHTHDFPGVDIALTPFLGAEPQRDAVQRLLDGTLRVEICADQSRNVRVFVDNLGAGHNLPSGASQDRRLWVEVRVYKSMDDAAPSFVAGVPPEGGSIETIDGDMKTWLFRDRAFDANGGAAHMFWKVARVEEGTLLAPLTSRSTEPGYHRELASKAYRLDLDVATPARITATVKMTPVGRDVLDDLVASNDIDVAVRDAVPTFTLVPNRASTTDDSVTLEWIYDRVKREGFEDLGFPFCLQTGPPRQ